jgi:hypothetical protein
MYPRESTARPRNRRQLLRFVVSESVAQPAKPQFGLEMLGDPFFRR